MSKITLTDLVNLENETTAVNAINANSTVIQTAFDNTLSRDGTAPNQMQSTLDMNSNRIINLPAPIADTEPLRRIDGITAGLVGPQGPVGPAGQVNSITAGTGISVTGTATVPIVTNTGVRSITAGTGITVTGTTTPTVSFSGTVAVPYISSLAYGLVGNGTTDDYPAMQSFLTALGNTGGVGILAPGNYYMGSGSPTLRIATGKSSIQLLAHGAVITSSTTTGYTGLVINTVPAVTREDEARKVVIEGLRIDHFQNPIANYGIQVQNASTHVVIKDCIFNAGADSAGLQNQSNYEAINFLYDATLNGDYWSRVMNCTIHGASFSMPYGIVLTGQQNAFVIENCDLSNVTNGIVWQGDTSGNLPNAVRVINNDFEGVAVALSQITFNAGSRLAGMIANFNRIESVGTFFQYTLVGNPSSAAPIVGSNILISATTYIYNPNSLTVVTY